MSYKNLILAQPDTGIYLLTVNRPDALNALNTRTFREIAAALSEIREDPGARVLLVTGGGDKAFVAGADIVEMRDYTPIEARAFAELAISTMRSLEMLPIPTIAVVNGYALGGGCELALACDWILAGDRAVFGQPEVNLAIPPGFGGTQRLTRLIGANMAREMIFTGRQVKADEAQRIGLVNHVFANDILMDEAIGMARMVAGKAPFALRMAKSAILRGRDMDLENGCALEVQAFALCFSTEDRKEGMSAFLEKRSARFRGE